MYIEKCNEGIVLNVAPDRHKALADFYRQVEKRAFRMAEIETRNSSDAIDLVQDAMVALMKRYRHHPSEQWRPLFYRILQNKIKDWHRRMFIRNRVYVWRGNTGDDQPDFEEQLISPDASPAQQYSEDTSIERVQAALSQISHRQRQAFLLRVWEGFDVADTARIMSCSQGSVKTHLSRALAALREILGEKHE